MLGSTRSHILTPLLLLCLINCYDVHIKTMFGFYLPPVVCRRAHVLSTLFVFAGVKWYLTRIDRLRGMALSCGRRELLSLRWCLGSPPDIGAVHVAQRFSFLSGIFLVCLSSSSVLCAQCYQFLWVVRS